MIRKPDRPSGRFDQFRQFRASVITSSVFVALLALLHMLGFISPSALMVSSGISTASVVVFYILFHGRFNERAADPALVAPQTILGSLTVLYAMYDADAARGALAIILLIILFLGAFRYSAKSTLFRAAYLLSGYAIVIGMAVYYKPGKVNLRLDIAHWLVTACAMVCFVWTGSYINRLRDRLRERKVFYQSIWETCGDAVIVVDETFRVQYANPAMRTIFGYTAAEAIGMTLAQFQPPVGQHQAEAGLFDVIRASKEGNGSHTAEALALRRDGASVPTEVTYNEVVFEGRRMMVAFVRDVSERKRTENRVRFMAHHDTLTGLPNRALLEDRIAQAIHYGARCRSGLWIVFIDLDRFKYINDSLGHRAGDALLNIVSQRLQAAVRDIDTVGRLGGDEFIVLLPERGGQTLTLDAVQRIMNAVAQPLVVEGHELFVSCSIGISTFPADGTDSETLVAHADMAMYRAKENGRNNFQFFTAEMNDGFMDRLDMEGDLRNAIDQNELLLHYQPQVDLRTGRIVGMEALLRWNHPVRGMVPPARFIRLAEETGLIMSIGHWVLRTACAQNKAWQMAGLGNLRVAVNLSARQFTHAGLVASITGILDEAGLDAKYLDIELTESLVMTDVENVTSTLRELKEVGVQISIDDFGTGYSSLAYLSRFPIDVLKIDQSFVLNVASSPDDAAIVASIISLAHNLRLHVIAEGVETEAQLDYLRRHGCEEMQGYLFSKAVPAKNFETLLRAQKRLPEQTAVPVLDIG